jgi:hypothetical protein
MVTHQVQAPAVQVPHMLPVVQVVLMVMQVAHILVLAKVINLHHAVEAVVQAVQVEMV